MPADPHHLDLATRLGASLATYWVHAAVAIGATWVLVRTALRTAPASTRALVWRAAMVVPLVTSVARSEWIAQGPQVEVDWLGRAERTNATVEQRGDDADRTGDTDTLAGTRAGEPVVAPRVGAALEAAQRGGVTDDAPGSRSSVSSAGGSSVTGSSVTGPLASDAPTPGRRTDGDAHRDRASDRTGAASFADAGSTAHEPVRASADEPAPGAALGRTATPDASPSATRDAAAAPTRFPLDAIDPRRLALLVAAAAAVIALARWLDGWLRLGRTLGRREPLAPELAERAANLARAMGVPTTRVRASATARVPMAFGFLRPQVCLPRDFEAGLTRAEWDAAVAHELAHVVRGDTRWLPGLRLVTRLFSFQPLNRLAWRELERESEHAADEIAVGAVGSPRSLALCLAKVATRATGDRGVLPAAAVTGAPTMAARASLVVERTERLLAGRFEHRFGRKSRTGRCTRLAATLPTLVVALAAPHLTPSFADDALDASLAVDAVAEEAVASDADRPARRVIDASTAGVGASADATTANAPRTEVDALTNELARELEQARRELERARTSTAPRDRARLDQVARTLDRLDASFELVLALLADGVVDGDAPPPTDHGLDARANASGPHFPSPTPDPDRDLDR